MDFIGGDVPMVLSEYGVRGEKIGRNIFGDSKLHMDLSRKLSMDLKEGGEGPRNIGLPTIKEYNTTMANKLNYQYAFSNKN